MRYATLFAAAFIGIAAIADAALAGSPTTGDFAGKVAIDGGRALFLRCSGTGAPTVILISGYRNDGEIWTIEPAPGVAPVFDAITAFTRVCTYDRPGTILDATHRSRSDPVPMPRTATEIVAEMRALLIAAKVEPPYVLAAHSLGGLFARLYVSTYPAGIAGLVLVDAWQEDLPEFLGPEQWQAYSTLSDPPPPGLEKDRDLEMVDFGAASATMRGAAEAASLPAIPLYVLSRAKPVTLPPNPPASFDPEAFEKSWRRGQDRLAALLPTARHVIATESDHYIQVEQPELVVSAIRAVVEAVRDPSSWPR